jgi:hypothetical protein
MKKHPAESQEIHILLRSMDEFLETHHPAFRSRWLTADAAQFIKEEAEEAHPKTSFKLIIQIGSRDSIDKEAAVREIRKYFSYCSKQADRGFAKVRYLGWRTLLVAFAVLTVIILLIEGVGHYLSEGTLTTFLQQGLTILAWVALWRPAELLLYEWYPFKRDSRLYQRLQTAIIEFR